MIAIWAEKLNYRMYLTMYFSLIFLLGLIPEVVFGQQQQMPGIVNGQKAQRGEFPWMASIQWAGSTFHGCGASIIDKNWILTAAHCVIDQKTGKTLPRKWEIVV